METYVFFIRMFTQVTVLIFSHRYSAVRLPILVNTTNASKTNSRNLLRESEKKKIKQTEHIIVDVKGKNAPFPETCRYGNRILTNLRSGGPTFLFLWKARVSLSSRRVPLAQVKFSQRSFKAVLREWGGATLNSVRVISVTVTSPEPRGIS